MKRMQRSLALGVAALCLLGGCGDEPGSAAPRKEPDTVRVSTDYFGLAHYQNGTLDPVTDASQINRPLCEALYEGLFEVGENFTAVPVLCADYTGDGTSFTFTLKPDVTFWSGAKLTAQDVVASLKAAQDSDTSPYRARLTEVSAIEAVGTDAVRLTLSSPNAALPRLLDIPIRREGADGFSDGTGAFHPVTENGVTRLVANEAWHGGYLGAIRSITLIDMVRADAAIPSFETGDVSLLRTERVSGDSIVISGSVETVQTPSANLHYLGVNHGSPQLQDARVRRALSAAINRRGLCDTQLQTFADPAVLPVNPQPVSEELTLSMEASTETAAALLRELALEEPLSVRLIVNADNQYKSAAADQIAASWGAVGVQVSVQKLDSAAFLSAVQGGEFDLYYGETRMTPDFDLRPLLSAGGSLNYGGYESSDTAQAVAAARAGQDVGTLYARLLDEMPILPLAFSRDQILLRKGLIANFTPAPYNVFAGQQHWTIAEPA